MRSRFFAFSLLQGILLSSIAKKSEMHIEKERRMEREKRRERNGNYYDII